MKKKLLAILLTGAMIFSVFALVGCGNDTPPAAEDTQVAEETPADANGAAEDAQATEETPTDANGAAGEEQPFAGVRIELWRPGVTAATADEETDHDRRVRVLYDYIREVMGIDLVVELTPFAAYDDRSSIALASGTGPDVVQVNSVTLATFAHLGYLQETAHLMDASSLSRDEFFPGIWQHVIYNDREWGLPLDTGSRAVIYNVDLLAESGITLGDRTSWDDFLAATVAVTQPGDGTTDVFGYSFRGGEPWGFLYEGLGMFVLQNDGHFLSPDRLSGNFSSPEVLEAARVLVELQDSGVVPRDAITFIDDDTTMALFMSGRLGMFTGGFWSLDQVLENNPDFEVGVTLLYNTTIGSSSGGWVLGLANRLDNPEAAWAMLELIYEPNNLISFTSSIMPATFAAVEVVDTDPLHELFYEVLPVATHPIAINRHLPEIAQMVNDQMQRILLHEISLEDGMAELDASVTALLQR